MGLARGRAVAGRLRVRHDQIAVACWARDCRVGRAKRLAGLVWVDVIRRDPLTASQPYPSTLLATDTAVPVPTSAQLEERPAAAVSVVGSQRKRPSSACLVHAREDGPLDVPRTVIDLDALRTDTTAPATGLVRGGGTASPPPSGLDRERRHRRGSRLP